MTDPETPEKAAHRIVFQVLTEAARGDDPHKAAAAEAELRRRLDTAVDTFRKIVEAIRKVANTIVRLPTTYELIRDDPYQRAVEQRVAEKQQAFGAAFEQAFRQLGASETDLTEVSVQWPAGASHPVVVDGHHCDACDDSGFEMADGHIIDCGACGPCTLCGGDAMQEPDDPIAEGFDLIPCKACRGTGEARHQVVW